MMTISRIRSFIKIQTKDNKYTYFHKNNLEIIYN